MFNTNLPILSNNKASLEKNLQGIFGAMLSRLSGAVAAVIVAQVWGQCDTHDPDPEERQLQHQSLGTWYSIETENSL